jgi:hypothetical protein
VLSSRFTSSARRHRNVANERKVGARVTDLSFQIFLSYARLDNIVPVGSGAQYGFISLLRANLAQKLALHGVTIWRDKEGIADGEQFTPKIAGAIAESQMMLLVLTPAFLKSEFCRAEVEAFAARWRDAPDFKDRFIVVLRTWIEPELWPEAARGQNGYRFYTSENDRDGAPEMPLYGNDGKPAPAFYDVIDRMAHVVERRVSSLAPLPAQAPSGQPLAPRTIYVAQTPNDMDWAYRTVVAELRNDGYAVVPNPETKIPDSKTAREYVDAALAGADVAIHLLGESSGVRDKSESIVPLQLERTAVRAEAAQANGFKRILFAPKVFVDPEEPDAAIGDRDPIAVRDRFGRGVDSDTVVGDGLSDFIVDVKRALRRTTPRVAESERTPLQSGAQVFVDFHPADVDYASALSRALRERGLRSRFAAVEDDKTQNRITNAELLRGADAVVYCWANASDAWLYAETAEYDDWQKLGRSRPFAMRAAIAGPPERVAKSLYNAESPPECVDVFVDLRAHPLPTPEALDPLVGDLARGRMTDP